MPETIEHPRLAKPIPTHGQAVPVPFRGEQCSAAPAPRQAEILQCRASVRQVGLVDDSGDTLRSDHALHRMRSLDVAVVQK